MFDGLIISLLLLSSVWVPQVISQSTVPPNSVFVDPTTFAVLGANATFRENAFSADEFFNPTNSSPPFFQIFDASFIDVLGESPAIYEVASNSTFAFAHEAPIYVPETDEVFFASNAGGDLGMSDWDHNNVISKISMTQVEAAIDAANASGSVNVPYTTFILAETVQMANGGTGPYNGSLLVVTSGRAYSPPSIVLIDPYPPYDTTVLLDNFFGRQFNSLNDIKVHPLSRNMFFTDPAYGWLGHFRPLPLMPAQIYRFDPLTGSVRVVADGIGLPNGIAFSPNGSTCYIGDTSSQGGFLGVNQTLPSTIYAFDVDAETEALKNRRVFAYVDTGIADGINVDTQGNVYASAGDGVHVWNNKGTLIGKIYLGTGSANLVFAGPGRLLVLSDTKISLVRIAAEGMSL
ncbi:calcium-dependent phosphotriesterase [Desarmillaria tabescens]|uniref:Calcium-dependent phosphotriesterase n=1 Tax=Armillaria tabescens TaxID=1929756 RepID=A0AA39K6W6_ARMTA|nr:calcium-dependent phosphotriesterase [Desarmillaria tabescens]KAK0455408.1 calcium-dependent phosphotriesterase [Desarmillaria tabescens]